MWPGLLDDERARLDGAAGRDPIPDQILRRLDLAPDALAVMPRRELAQTIDRNPSLKRCYLLLRANGQVASSHLALTKRFLFNPMRRRHAAGIGDGSVVSNWAGTTGMLERLLERLASARKRHALASLSRVAPMAGLRPEEPPDGLPEALLEPGHVLRPTLSG